MHDGCAGQYAGKTNFHQTAEWFVKTGVFRGQLRLETMRGKGGCDGISNVVPSTVHNAIKNDELLHPSTRELVIFLARHKPTPSVNGESKLGWWAADEFIWVHYDTRLFTASRVPLAEGFKGSSEMHAIFGRSSAKEAAEQDGPINVRGMFCACQSCRVYDFSPGACMMSGEFGHYKIVHAKRAVARNPRTTRLQDLAEFARSLRTGQVHAIAAARDERHIEGNVWLVRLLSEAYIQPEDMLHSTDRIEAGWWVVKAQYYNVVQRSPRGYLLHQTERVIVVNHLIRLPQPIQFEPTRQSPRLQPTNQIMILSDKEYYAIESSMQDV